MSYSHCDFYQKMMGFHSEEFYHKRMSGEGWYRVEQEHKESGRESSRAVLLQRRWPVDREGRAHKTCSMYALQQGGWKECPRSCTGRIIFKCVLLTKSFLKYFLPFYHFYLQAYGNYYSNLQSLHLLVSLFTLDP